MLPAGPSCRGASALPIVSNEMVPACIMLSYYPIACSEKMLAWTIHGQAIQRKVLAWTRNNQVIQRQGAGIDKKWCGPSAKRSWLF